MGRLAVVLLEVERRRYAAALHCEHGERRLREGRESNCVLESMTHHHVARASRAPAAPSKCPVAPFVELTSSALSRGLCSASNSR